MVLFWYGLSYQLAPLSQGLLGPNRQEPSISRANQLFENILIPSPGTQASHSFPESHFANADLSIVDFSSCSPKPSHTSTISLVLGIAMRAEAQESCPLQSEYQATLS